ncbi:glycosyl hydrolase family 95 catalytic domain-containing protein [Spirosoma sordidisoli]|uniref:Glycoside hydrolase family 95 protein n=1 Tax=Spirosoma sordidisoli TaxID=2502893 RepID=A0A4Q2UNQ8_9BACT|nr:glycoside hydrolase N-terminal domain-containing protein [Spirosoma sordidisoli]RYC70966.1 glycoside hydrolase family 95 protein [Spirosoma sordidisoli]
MKKVRLFFFVVASLWTGISIAQKPRFRNYRLWYDKPVPNLPITNLDSLNAQTLVEATPLDPAWENWSLPIGNGYMGASLFGRTVTERIQLTENSMAAKSLYGGVGLTNFAELYLDFNHKTPQKYSRSLRLNDAVSTVKYEQDGVRYEREYIASYPDKVLAIRLTASQKNKLSFTVRPEIPYKKPIGPASKNNGRVGRVSAQNDLITLSGKLEHLNIRFEGQFRVIPTGGTLKAITDADGDNGKIVVTGADAALILVAVGTNYKLDSSIFEEHTSSKKLADTTSPHRRVTAILEKASAKTYAQLLASHRNEYSALFDRATVNLGANESALTTDALLNNYKAGVIDPYLEELYFQYGRYLLICSSRPGTLPPNLQGIWSQYDITPWTGGYWHNINIQMNYWPVFTTNLTELFQSFADYNLAYRRAATQGATDYLKRNNPHRLVAGDGENGWTIGTGASAYSISKPGIHSGPGTGTMTTKLFWDYYAFTGDKQILKNITYPALLGMSKFLAKVVVDTAGVLLTYPSYSPEQRWQKVKEHYKTMGTAFDQQMIYENHRDVLKAAQELGDTTPFLAVIQAQLPRLDPVLIGMSGQIKEYREENYYGEIGDPRHRHTSQLVGLYPGTLINSTTPAWLDAAKTSLNGRGDKATGWGMAFRLNLWARTKDGDRAYALYRSLLQKGTLNNLWDTHPPFQIDGNFGGTAGVAEMLLQSHEGFIDLLPALPQAWKTGAYSGLLARGNFEVSAQWTDGQARRFTIKSNAGGLCQLRYPNIHQATVQSATGNRVPITSLKRDFIAFATQAGDVFTITGLPAASKVANPSNLHINEQQGEKIVIRWDKSPDAVAYNIYSHVGNSPDYTLIQANCRATTTELVAADVKAAKHGTLRVTAVDETGRESSGLTVQVIYAH